MKRSTADIIVKIFAVLAFISAAFSAFAGIAAIIGGAVAPQAAPGVPGIGGLGVAGVIGGIILLVLAVLYLAVGVGLWRHQNWARVTMLVLAWISAITSILALVGVGANGFAWSSLIGLLIAGFEIWFFQFVPEVREMFGAARTSRATATPVAGKR